MNAGLRPAFLRTAFPRRISELSVHQYNKER